MKKILAFLVKLFGKFLAYLTTFFSCYLLSLMISGVLLSGLCLVWSIFQTLPETIATYYWLIMLFTAVPFSLIFFIHTMIKVHRK